MKVNWKQLAIDRYDRVQELLNAMESVLFVARGAPDEYNRCSICRIAQEALTTKLNNER